MKSFEVLFYPLFSSIHEEKQLSYFNTPSGWHEIYQETSSLLFILSLFTKLTNNEFDTTVKHGINSLLNIEDMVFSPSPVQQIMFDKLNNRITQNSFCTDSEDEDTDDEGKSTNCYYYSTEEFQKAKFNTSTSFAIFHLNIHSVQLHIEELRMYIT